MQRFQEKYNMKRTLLEIMGQLTVFNTHASTVDEPYDVFVYVVVTNRVTKAKWKEILGDFAPLIPDSLEGPVGHCFKQVVVGTHQGPIQYFGTVQQPCDDLNVVVGLDPDNLPTVYSQLEDTGAGASSTWTEVTYTLAFNDGADTFTWDGGAPTTVTDHTVDVCVPATTAGYLWILRDGTPSFAADTYGQVDIEVYLPSC